MRRQETADHVTVLLGLEAAGGIEDPSAGPDPKGRVIEKGLEQIHGKEKADHMAGLVRAVWEADRQAAASTASATG